MKKMLNQYLKGSPKTKPVEPRELTVIMEEYGQLAGRLGQAYYRKQVLEADIAEFTSRIANLDREATARKEKDAKHSKDLEGAQDETSA